MKLKTVIDTIDSTTCRAYFFSPTWRIKLCYQSQTWSGMNNIHLQPPTRIERSIGRHQGRDESPHIFRDGNMGNENEGNCRTTEDRIRFTLGDVVVTQRAANQEQ
jgi:hypothetical protein